MSNLVGIITLYSFETRLRLPTSQFDGIAMGLDDQNDDFLEHGDLPVNR